MRIVKRASGQSPIFKSKKDIPAKGIVGFTPLQAADILAYELKKLRDLEGKPLPAGYHFRFPYEQLDKIPGQPMLFGMESAIDVGDLFKVDEYSRNNPLTKYVQ